MLETIPFFSGLSDRELDAIGKQTVTRCYPKHHIIIVQGDPANSLYFVVRGRVCVFSVGADGKRMVFGERGPGACVGELALLTQGRRSASVETTEETEVASLTKRSFDQIVSANPNIALSLMRNVAERFCSLATDMSDLALLNVYERIAKLIRSRACSEGGRRITGRLTHRDIADRVGASREMVTKVLRELSIGGYISVERKRIIIEKPLPEHW